MASTQVVVHPVNTSFRYNAQWCGGPPPKELQELWGKLRLVGINVTSQAEFKQSNRPFIIPPGTNLILINQEVCNAAFSDAVRVDAKQAKVPVVPVFSDFARTRKALIMNKIISDTDVVKPAPVAAAPATPVAVEEPPMSAAPKITSPIDQLLNCDPTLLDGLPSSVRDAILQARKAMARHQVVAPLIAGVANLDEEALLAFYEGLPQSTKDNLAAMR